jgi:tight adherence protein B
MDSLLIIGGFFLAAFVSASLAVTYYWAVHLVREQREGTAADEGEADVPSTAILKGENLSTIRVWERLLERFSQVETLRRQILEAGLPWSVGRVTLMMLLLGTCVWAILSRLPSIPSLAIWAAVIGAASIPYLNIRRLRNKRFRAFASQFPEALDSLSRALKAGHPLSAGIELLATEQPEPLAGEMRRLRDEWKLGVGWDQALDHLAARIPISEVRLFAAAVKMQNRMGGRLNDVLGRLAETMRDQAEIEGEMQAVSAHSRLTGSVLTVLPLGIGLVLFLVNPEYVGRLFKTPEGRLLLTVTASANVAAHFVIRQLVKPRF